MLTPKQYAERIDAAYSTVMSWLQRDLIPGAQKQELPSGGWYYVVPEDAPRPELKPGPKTFEERLNVIAAEILEELSDQYVDFFSHAPAQDSNDWGLTYKTRGGRETSVTVIRRSGQTDDEVKDEILAQLSPKTDGPRRASKKAAKKKGARAK